MKQPAIIIAFALLLGLSASTLSADPSDHDPKIDPEILKKLKQGNSRVDVIVVLTGYEQYVAKVQSDNASLLAVQKAIGSAQNNILNRIPPSQIEIKHLFENILGFSGRATKAGIQELASLPEVFMIEEDGIVYAHLAQGIPLMNASAARSLYDGSGVSVAIVDTGIDYRHSMLGGGGFPNAKVIGGYDFGDDDPYPLDCNGHGTSVAGIAAGVLSSGPGDYIGGVAHNAKLYALKIVPGCENWAYNSDIAAAWDWAVTHQYDDPDNPILIINTSFGGSTYLTACDSSQQTLAAAADNAVANGITLFGSSGNDGYAEEISLPACVSSSLSVGAVYDAETGYHGYGSLCTDPITAADQVPCYSNSADFLDLLAPSHNAYTTAVGGGYTAYFGGTSAASPYAAGIGALVQSYGKFVDEVYYSPAELKTRLSTGDLITDARNNITKPRVNADTALFGPCLSPARVIGTSTTYFDLLQNAFISAGTGNNGGGENIVEMQDYIFVEDIHINNPASIILRAGYDCGYTSNEGVTTIQGSMTTQNGTLTLESGMLNIQE